MYKKFTTDECFNPDWHSAHLAFLDCCKRHGLVVETISHPMSGPNGERLGTALAWYGPRDSERVLVLVSGTHGLEGLAGSGCQLSWIENGGLSRLPHGTGVLIVHILNPWGCAWGRRQTEENIDLNRNFRDFESEPPKNAQYGELHERLVVADRSNLSRALVELRAELGADNLANALFQGQYTHPTGIGFGGQRPAWSNDILRDALKRNCSDVEQVIVIDIHTGLGEYAAASILSMASCGSKAADCAKRVFGRDLIEVNAEHSPLPYLVKGDLCTSIASEFGTGSFGIALEFGTFESSSLVELQIWDCWLHNFGEFDSPMAVEHRSKLRDFFYPQEVSWKQKVAALTSETIEKSCCSNSASTSAMNV